MRTSQNDPYWKGKAYCVAMALPTGIMMNTSSLLGGMLMGHVIVIAIYILYLEGKNESD